MKLKAEMGHYSSIVGGSVHLIAEDGRMVGQVAILCHTDDLRSKDAQTALLTRIRDAINAAEKPDPRIEVAAKAIALLRHPECRWPEGPEDKTGDGDETPALMWTLANRYREQAKAAIEAADALGKEKA